LIQVDKHIRKLDSDLLQFENELKLKLAHRRSGELTDNPNFSEASLGSQGAHLHSASLGAGADKRKKKKIEQPAVIMYLIKPYKFFFYE
jgi:hypothetical protein